MNLTINFGKKETSLGIHKPVEGGRKARIQQKKEIFQMIKDKNMEVKRPRTFTMSRKTAKTHYAEHNEKPFFESLINFMTSGKVTVYKPEGENAIQEYRDLCGKKEIPGTIRSKFAIDATKNTVHSADSAKSAAKEGAFFYKPGFLIRNFSERITEKAGDAIKKITKSIK